MTPQEELQLIRRMNRGDISPSEELQIMRALDSGDIGLLSGPSENTLGIPKAPSFEEMRLRASGRQEGFDYETGADGKLRALMSFGETPEEREAILAAKVGEKGYTRDEAGRLALTPEGQRARGMEPSDKNIVIEEEGLSFRDVSDLAGIAPETIGSIIGTAVGGGATFGLGSIAGAAGGAAAGQALEETLEGLLGVQRQSLPDIGKDLLKEAAIGAAGEIIGAGVVMAGKKIIGAGSNIAGRVASRSPAEEIAADRLARMQDLVDRGYVPSMEALGAPRPVAYSQKFFENAAKVTKRIDNNVETALKEKAKFLEGISEDAATKLGEDVGLWYSPGQFGKLTAAQNNAQKSIIRAINDSIDLLSDASKRGLDVDNETIAAITKAFDELGQKAADDFGTVDTILNAMSVTGRGGGGGAKLFDTESIRTPLKEYMDQMRNLADPAVEQAKIFLQATSGTGRASFNDLATLRKFVNDNLYFGGNLSTRAGKSLEEVREALDTMLNNKTILNSIDNGALSEADQALLKSAAEQRNKAMENFRVGMDKFEKLERLGLVRQVGDLKDLGQGYGRRVVSDQFFDKAVKRNSPERLKAVFNAVDNPSEIQDAFARRYLEDAMSQAKADIDAPDTFSGPRFEGYIQRLGSTGPVLFGKEWDQVKKLAREIGKSTADVKVTAKQIDQIMDIAPGSKIGAAMSDLAKATRASDQALSVKVLKDISTGKLESFDEIGRALTSRGLKKDDAVKIMRFLDNNPEVKVGMKNAVLQDVLSSIDDQIFKSQKNANVLKETISKYQPGTLQVILGDDTYKAVKGFADDLADLGDVGKEGSIAASGIWANFLKHPISALGTVTQFKLLANAMSRPEVAKAYLAARRSAGPNIRAQGEAMLRVMNQAVADEGVDAGALASRAGRIAGAAATGVSRAGSLGRDALIRGSGLASYEPMGREGRDYVAPDRPAPRFEIPEVTSPMMLDLPSRPLSPMEQLRTNVRKELSLRQRARENPAVASTLLGGLGSADLL